MKNKSMDMISFDTFIFLNGMLKAGKNSRLLSLSLF